jgi:hypothetical protein
MWCKFRKIPFFTKVPKLARHTQIFQNDYNLGCFQLESTLSQIINMNITTIIIYSIYHEAWLYSHPPKNRSSFWGWVTTGWSRRSKRPRRQRPSSARRAHKNSLTIFFLIHLIQTWLFTIKNEVLIHFTLRKYGDMGRHLINPVTNMGIYVMTEDHSRETLEVLFTFLFC